MCGSKCQRCGGYESLYGGHPRGCTLPASTREAILYSGLPVEAVEAAIAAAEDKALEVWGQDYLRERRNEDALARAAKPPESRFVTIPQAGQVFAVNADGVVQIPQPVEGAWQGAPWTVTFPGTAGPVHTIPSGAGR